MKAIETTAAGTLAVRELPVPKAGPGEVVIRMLTAGICAGDMQIFHGRHKFVTFPLIQGHEGIGVIHEIGPGTEGLCIGDRVNIQQQLACGVCYACRRGYHNVCVSMKGLIGVQVAGLFSEYVKYPAWNAVKVPDGMRAELGAVTEPASVAVNAAAVSGIGPGERAVVIGAGAIGNFTAQACRARGAADVLIADIAPSKLETARRCGIPHCINSGAASLQEAIAEAFGGEPADAVFDCAGAESTLRQAIAAAGSACRAVIVANFKEPVLLDIPLFQRRQVSVLSVMGTTKASTRQAAEYLHEGTMTVSGMITNRFPLERMPEAYQYLEDNAELSMKVLIDIGAE